MTFTSKTENKDQSVVFVHDNPLHSDEIIVAINDGHGITQASMGYEELNVLIRLLQAGRAKLAVNEVQSCMS